MKNIALAVTLLCCACGDIERTQDPASPAGKSEYTATSAPRVYLELDHTNLWQVRSNDKAFGCPTLGSQTSCAIAGYTLAPSLQQDRALAERIEDAIVDGRVLFDGTIQFTKGQRTFEASHAYFPKFSEVSEADFANDMRRGWQLLSDGWTSRTFSYSYSTLSKVASPDIFDDPYRLDWDVTCSNGTYRRRCGYARAAEALDSAFVVARAELHKKSDRQSYMYNLSIAQAYQPVGIGCGTLDSCLTSCAAQQTPEQERTACAASCTARAFATAVTRHAAQTGCFDTAAATGGLCQTSCATGSAEFCAQCQQIACANEIAACAAD